MAGSALASLFSPDGQRQFAVAAAQAFAFEGCAI